MGEMIRNQNKVETYDRARKEINQPNLYDKLEVFVPSGRPERPMYLLSLKEILLLRYGIGKSSARWLSVCAGYHPATKYSIIASTVPMQKVEQFFTRNRTNLDYDQKKKGDTNINLSIEMYTYRGTRHKHGLPVRGQRTRSNYSTARKRNSSVTTKKKVYSKMQTRYNKKWYKAKGKGAKKFFKKGKDRKSRKKFALRSAHRSRNAYAFTHGTENKFVQYDRNGGRSPQPQIRGRADRWQKVSTRGENNKRQYTPTHGGSNKWGSTHGMRGKSNPSHYAGNKWGSTQGMHGRSSAPHGGKNRWESAQGPDGRRNSPHRGGK